MSKTCKSLNTKLQVPLKVDNQEVRVSPHRQGLGGTLVLLTHRAVPRVVFVQLFTAHTKPIVLILTTVASQSYESFYNTLLHHPVAQLPTWDMMYPQRGF
jgi:hypothetical protein